MSTATSQDKKSWSICSRLTYWVASCVGVVFLIQVALVTWFVRDTHHRELDALAVEEMAELSVGLLQYHLNADGLKQFVKQLDREHPEAYLSVRAWRPPYEEVWVSAGAQPRVPWPAQPSALTGNAPVAVHPWLRRSSTETLVQMSTPDGDSVEEAILAELLIDGSPRAKDLKRMALFFSLIGILGAVAVVLVGIVLSKRVARMLEGVAESAEAARLDDLSTTAAPKRAPQEIRRVAEAFSDSIQKMRAEHSRNVLLTAGLAHELRSPLQNLISEAEVGLLSHRDGDEYRRLIGFLLDESRALALVVDNLITLTALRDHQALPRGERFHLGDELRMRLSHEYKEASRRGIQLEMRELGESSLTADREAIVLMVRNLVGNAIRWTGAGHWVGLILDGRGESFQLSVEDQGPGIPPDEREAIFEAFYQGNTPSGSRAGYGLGLALARAAARSEGGDIEVSARQSGGSRFTVTLPPRTLDRASCPNNN